MAEKTREAILVCEAAGFDVILVETVGVGQSETTVAGMVDVFVLLQLPNAGDDLQAMKKGIVELADVVVITKADIDHQAAELARQQFAGALSLLHSPSPSWTVSVLSVSAASASGIDVFWAQVERCREQMTAAGEFQAKRRRQAVDWMWALIDSELRPPVSASPPSPAAAWGRSAGPWPPANEPAAAACELLGYLEE